jgi:hypothetical protein
VTLTPESDYFYSLEHQPLVTDSIGRAFELRQSDPPEEPTFTSSYVEALGGGGYFDQTYNNVVISTQSFPINVRSVFQAPAYAASVADINSPVFQSIDINIAGVAPETFLNETWTGKTFITESSNPMNIFTPDWTRSGLLAAENFAGKFD